MSYIPKLFIVHLSDDSGFDSSMMERNKNIIIVCQRNMVQGPMVKSNFRFPLIIGTNGTNGLVPNYDNGEH